MQGTREGNNLKDMSRRAATGGSQDMGQGTIVGLRGNGDHYM